MNPLIEVIEKGEKHRRYYCDGCGWAEDDAELIICTCCNNRLVCRDCRNGLTRCIQCAEYNLPEEIQVVGNNEKCDLIFETQTWVGLCMASHYYVSVKIPYEYNRYGRIDFSYLEHDFHDRYTTEQPQRIPDFIRRLLKVVVAKHKMTINRRKDKKLRISIKDRDSRSRLMKYMSTRPLDGD